MIDEILGRVQKELSFLRCWLVPGEGMGDAYIRLRMKASLWDWEPSHDEDRTLKDAIARIAPQFTMLDLNRLRSLVKGAEEILRRGVPGAIVECGSWRGGALALVDWVFRRRNESRKQFAFDSFEGLPPPGPGDPWMARRCYYPGLCSARPADVECALEALGGPSNQLTIVPGWLSQTLPSTETGPIALLIVDVDWHDSVDSVLRFTHQRVSKGGLVYFDDYDCWP
ncbi:MAG: class I SAM-dependent methyltransferase, partial [Deltaproteobacteria bacterium]|nr:class I SAM-dependent methyltransferase [Deltaproteobacteria bacterium]